MTTKQKLELTWIGKDKTIKVEPRILIHDETKDYGDKNTGNMLIYGDNLLALKALEQDYAGKVKCIYIDPPYNTGSAFEHYDDNLEHSTWLNLMKPRLEILRNLLSDDGSLWVSLDDNEQAYCKVLLDEIFGRKNFVCNVIWQKKYSPSNDAKWFSDNHDFVIVYAKNKEIWRPNLLPRTATMNERYKNPDNDPRGPWKTSDFSVRTYNAACDYPITLPSGRVVYPPDSRCWVSNEDKYNELVRDNRIWFGEKGNNVPAVKRFLSEVKQGITSLTIWTYGEVGHNQDAKKEVKQFNSNDVFDTPKPERLIERVLTLGSNKGDLVLDSFLGSGTTAAVAHKMGRKYIGIELGEHCHTHCIPRLQKVIDGTDQGGISKTVGWKGGGGFKYYYLAPSLLNKDKYGQYVISKEYNADMLAAAMAKNEGFLYAPDQDQFWKQGKSSENDYIYTTTSHVGEQALSAISADMKDGESLLICCKSFDKGLEGVFPNISIKKIPAAILGRCEFGKDNYNLNIINPPAVEEEEE